ncbi:DNA excision repair protein ERCC-6-like [Epargyreus clarus]|uniref:DNA excision repair protein ERCC-6-like n=1 Tax=Epargyreus clarus TaxID=520877 RepID=UPI003C2AC3A1
MVDINKYLETQLALAKQKNVEKDCNKKNTVSQKSITAADRITKKQDKHFMKSTTNESSDACLSQPSVSAPKEPDSDEEYLPSSDEEDRLPIATTSSSRVKHNLKKIIDDGDSKLYNERVTSWRNSLTAATLKKFDENYYSADIHYVLDENGNPDESHELQNGLQVPNYIWKQLYKYQRTGVKWLWELHQVQSGGIVGDEMGLGKTVQIIAFLAGLLKVDSGSWGGLGPSIIVAPATVIYQWVSHFHYWCPPLRVAVLHHSGSHSGNHNKLIRDIHAAHGILLISYAGIVKYTKDLVSKKWHYIILDEGHKIRNPETQVSKVVKKFQTPHKLLITGSPMQNSLQELWSLFDFIRPGLLGTYNAFMDHFAVPITQGGYANATEIQEATALEIAKALKNMITPYMLRRTKAEVQEHIKLPEKNEQVLFCALTKEQRDLYMGYLTSGIVRNILDKDNKYEGPLRARVLVALSTLRKICNHPDLYLYEAQEECEEINSENFGHWKRSGKMSVVHSLLKLWHKQGHRTLVFSQSRAMICILEQHLQNCEYKYLKMDSSVTVSQRQNLIKTFNENQDYLVFLSTTRVGGLGVNLTGADRVIIYDPDWNPATDNQAKERAWRIGQKRNVTVYRLLSAGTIEEKIYQRQIFKNFLSNKILIDPNQKNVLTTSTLQGLFTLDELNCNGDTETASLFKHTKVNLNNKKKDDKILLSGSVSFSKKKLEAMRRRAKEISKKISKDNNADNKIEEPEEDPREKYKKRREIILNPPAPSEDPEINLLDDKVTNVPFEDVLSEIDIINKHVKKDYEENLIREVLNSQNKETEEGELIDDAAELDVNDENELKSNMEDQPANKEIKEMVQDDHKNEDIKVEFINKNVETDCLNFKLTPNEEVIQREQEKISMVDVMGSLRKRKHSPCPQSEFENLLAVKKVKNKKHKKEKEKKLSDDDYVLSKLFAKATVKNALQHDVVVGLAEKERKYRMKEEATRNAKKAVRAVKFSTK